MAMSLAQDGYGLGVWWDGSQAQGAGTFSGVDGSAFLEAAIDDASGSALEHYSTENEHEQGLDQHPDAIAYDALKADPYGDKLLDVVASGDARPSDIAELHRIATEHGLSEEGFNELVDGLQKAVGEALQSESGEAPYGLNEKGELLNPDDPDGPPLFARGFDPQQMGFMDEGLSMQEAPRANQSDLDKQKLKESEAERLAAQNPERAKALEKLAELKRRGLSIDEYARQGSMFEASPSDAEIKLLREVAKGEKKAPAAKSENLFAREFPVVQTDTPAFKPHNFPVKDNTVDFGPRGAQIIGDHLSGTGRAR
jgi:hypothetical protein